METNQKIVKNLYLSRFSFRENSDLAGVSYRKAKINGQNMEGMDLSGVSFKGCQARRACFRLAYLSLADFSGADLRGADFTDADVTGCNFRGADLRGARIGADFRRADLAGADLRGAIIDRGAVLIAGQGRLGLSMDKKTIPSTDLAEFIEAEISLAGRREVRKARATRAARRAARKPARRPQARKPGRKPAAVAKRKPARTHRSPTTGNMVTKNGAAQQARKLAWSKGKTLVSLPSKSGGPNHDVRTFKGLLTCNCKGGLFHGNCWALKAAAALSGKKAA